MEGTNTPPKKESHLRVRNEQIEQDPRTKTAGQYNQHNYAYTAVSTVQNVVPRGIVVEEARITEKRRFARKRTKQNSVQEAKICHIYGPPSHSGEVRCIHLPHSHETRASGLRSAVCGEW